MSSTVTSKKINYTPPPTVRDFIVDYRPGAMFHDYIIGPVGSGKTTGLFFKLIYMAQLQAKSPIDGIRHSKAVVVRNTFPQLRDTTIPSWRYWFKDGIAGEWQKTENRFILRFADVECEVLFRALDTPDDVDRVLSLEVTFVILDEFVTLKKEIIEAIGARAGRYPPEIDGGATNWGMWGSSNPGNEDSWWYEHLIANPLPKHTNLYTQPAGTSPDAENTENLPGKRDYYAAQAEGKSDEWVKQFIECQWGFSLDGRPVFSMFRADLHVSKRPLIPNKFLPLILGIDPGRGMGAIVVGQEDLHGRLLIYDEIITRGMGAERVMLEKLMPLLRHKYPNFKPIVAPDPSAANGGQTDERSVIDVYRKHFAVKYDTNNTLTPRLSAVEHYMTRLTEVGPALLLDPGCKVLARAFGGGYRYTINRKDLESPEPEKNQYSHPADAAQYLAKYFRILAAKSERDKKLPPRRSYGAPHMLR